MENSNSDSLSLHTINIPGIDDELIVNLSSEVPRLNNFHINTGSYYATSSFKKIFDNSDHNINDAINAIHINIRGLETYFNDFVSYHSTFHFNLDIIYLSEAQLS